MIRTVLAIAIALGVTAAIAQEDPIKARKALMKTNGEQAKIVGDMAKGDTPFDLAAAQKAFATFQNAAAKMPTLYPDSSKGGDPTDDFNAGPKVWEDMADFKARFVKFGDDAKAADFEREGPGQPQGGNRQYRQERLRRLPPNLSRQEGLNGRQT